MENLFTRCHQLLAATDITTKVAGCHRLYCDWHQLDRQPIAITLTLPGRPDRPYLVPPGKVSRRRAGSRQGQGALIHAIAHIEFNAIQLALDAAYRFQDMPAAYYGDWLRVASEEATHFGWLNHRLQALGFAYGDFDAHDGLWQMAQKTADDVLKRMALVPRVLEARGLDITPAMIQRLQKIDDQATMTILHNILTEEIEHVRIGSYWFRYCCQQRDLEPDSMFQQLIQDYYGQLKLPFNRPARLASGFSTAELDNLTALSQPSSATR